MKRRDSLARLLDLLPRFCRSASAMRNNVHRRLSSRAAIGCVDALSCDYGRSAHLVEKLVRMAPGTVIANTAARGCPTRAQPNPIVPFLVAGDRSRAGLV